MFGFINVNKPSGMTSRHVVNHIQKILGNSKVGHAGTLDPLATGVLVVAVGPATRLVPYLHRLPKCYLGSFRLGLTSPTQDIDGDVEVFHDPVGVERDEVESTLPHFTGKIKQTPPKYSAIKIGGIRAYELARRGKTFTMPEREVEIIKLSLRKFDYPDFDLEVKCGSGTYMRTLGRDIALACKSDAVMAALRRTQVGTFDIANSCELEQLDSRQSAIDLIESPAIFLRSMSKRLIELQQMEDLYYGKVIRLDCTSEEVAAINDGRLIAIVSKIEDGTYKPKTNFVHYWKDSGIYQIGPTCEEEELYQADLAEEDNTVDDEFEIVKQSPLGCVMPTEAINAESKMDYQRSFF